MNRKYLILLLLLAILGALIVLWNPRQEPRPGTGVSNFKECTEAGYPVMESYPRQCSTPSGDLFIETFIPEM